MMFRVLALILVIQIIYITLINSHEKNLTCREKESLGPLLGGICGSLRFGEPVGVAVAERDKPGPIAQIGPAVPWWCSADVPI